MAKQSPVKIERPKPNQLVRVRNLSGREGYRRAGVAHTKEAIDHPADTFDDEQLAQLFDDPNIAISYVDAPKAEKAGS